MADDTALVRDCMAQVFGIDPADIPDDASRKNIEQWDSMMHLNLVMALEEATGTRFDPDEIPELDNLPAIAARLAKG